MRWRDDRGGVALEAAILVPALLAFVLAAVAAGRIQTAGGVVDAAARAGARAASLARAPGDRQKEAESAARAVLQGQDLACVSEQIDPLVDEPDAGTDRTGKLEFITVTVHCTVRLDDLLTLPGAPGKKTLDGKFTSVVDRYRGN